MKKRHQHRLDNKTLSYTFIPSPASAGLDDTICSDVIVRGLYPAYRDPERDVLRRILVVDSEPVIADMIALMCATFGCLTTTASSVKEACAAAKKHTFDLVITNYDLPQYNGLVLICKLRMLGLEIPAIVMTDNPSMSAFLQPTILKIAKVLVKPLTRASLKTALDECIR